MHVMQRLKQSFFAIFSACCFLFFAQGQPQPCGGAAFARVGNTFYIQGGATSGDNLLQQFWALDLTTSWSTSQPAWANLPIGDANAYHSAGYSADNKSFITFGRDTGADSNAVPSSWIYIFDIASNRWAFKSNPTELKDNSRRDFSVVTNPKANKNYILGGDAGPGGETYSNDFDIYDPSTRVLKETTTPLSGPQYIATYSAVWVPGLDAMMVIGGTNLNKTIVRGVYLYHPETEVWAFQATTGSFPYILFSACAASNANGSLVAVFGGFTGDGDADPNVYMLDTKSWAWTATQYSGRSRGNTACTIVDDSLIIWGGFYMNPNTLNGVPTAAEALLLFSLSSKTWLSKYTPSDALAGASKEGTNVPRKSGLSTGAIVGIVVGCVVLILLLAFIQMKRRRRNKKKHENASGDMGDVSGTGHFSGDMVEHGHYNNQGGPPSVSNLHTMKHSPEALLNHRRSTDGSPAGSTGNPELTTPTSLQFLMTGSEYGGNGHDGSFSTNGDYYNLARQSYLSDTTSGSAVPYYPPPPRQHGVILEEEPSVYSKDIIVDSEHRPNDPQTITNFRGYYSPNSYGEEGDQYHDSYGMKHASMISSGSDYLNAVPSSPTYPQGFNNNYSPGLPLPGPLKPKRPVSAPQGGEGFGSMLEVTPGAPQAILEYQSSISQDQQGEKEYQHEEEEEEEEEEKQQQMQQPQEVY
ncbi:hypothetical protein BX616_001762 [Lobosporangium transversale]|uniref:Attractin/MKLN-like beta-propeller domain-containing protein n=1 Tax=Lobosporangium transversale TaxID=64571 RepID=A0A1Y2H198_9FUNG|nr:hypothetical protein BCR41DRAFT_418418 [Lobosporangium transversale]KAF9902921.1 hypothetical protein BX616_001762 [Lobosporangium transversale]ORZ28329.1 hypothetical protein BCR41DRAFT_418418 [Lobosporangium transversale]|eukprot:XP_021886014.1 hypothetical protein BCR41DRAFT_418418 [Lobosporangium transversale]